MVASLWLIRRKSWGNIKNAKQEGSLFFRLLNWSLPLMNREWISLCLAISLLGRKAAFVLHPASCPVSWLSDIEAQNLLLFPGVLHHVSDRSKIFISD